MAGLCRGGQACALVTSTHIHNAKGAPSAGTSCGGSSKSKGGALKEPKHLCQGTFHLLSNSGDGQTEERRRGCSPSVPREENQSSLSEG